jgi:hypothetical protein
MHQVNCALRHGLLLSEKQDFDLLLMYANVTHLTPTNLLTKEDNFDLMKDWRMQNLDINYHVGNPEVAKGGDRNSLYTARI